MKHLNKLILISITLLCASFTDGGNENATVYFYSYDYDIHKRNKLVTEKQLPFFFEYKEVPDGDNVLDCSDTVEVVSLINNGDTTNVFVNDNNCEGYFSEVSKVYDQTNGDYYIVVVSEDIVGLDYFILIRESPLRVYISEKYNMEAEPYGFIEQSIDFTKNVIDVYYMEQGVKESVSFAPYTDR